MKLIDVYWTNIINVLVIKCDCGKQFEYPSNYSLVECPNCKNKEVWHEDALGFKELENYKLIESIINKNEK